MRSLRFTLRALRLAVVTVWWLAVLQVATLAARLAPRAGERRRRCRRWALRSWSAAVCRGLGVEIEVVGVPPSEACLLVSNHLSYLDIPVLGGLLDTVFVSKSEVADWPIVGYLTTVADTIYVERGRKRSLPEVNLAIAQCLSRGDGVTVFPEGTSTGGDGVLPFRPSLLAPAAELGLSVRHATLTYACETGDPPASEAVCWWGDASFAPHVARLLLLRRIRARVVFGPEAFRSPDRKELARKLWQGVSLAMTPLA